MFRRTIAILASFTVAMLAFTACTAAPTPKNPDESVLAEKWSDNPVEEGWTPQAATGQPYNSIVPISTPRVDTTDFTRPPHVSGIEVRNDGEYAVVTIDIAEADWRSFADQIGLEKNIGPGIVPVKGDTLDSLIDLDAVAEEFMQNQEQSGFAVYDIRTMEEVYYDLTVTSL